MKRVSAPQRAMRKADAADPGQWLRDALSGMLCATPDDVIARNGWPAKAMRGQSIAAHRKWLGKHSDDDPEVCIAISGRAIVEIDTRRFSLVPPRFAVIEPGVPHSEAFVRRSESYNVIWLRITRGSVLGQVCPYYLPEEWDRIATYSVPASVAPLLYDRLSDAENPVIPDQFDGFRAELVAVLAAMLLKATKPTPPRNVRHDPSTGRIRPPHHAIIEHLKKQILHDLSRPLNINQFAQATRLTPAYIRLLFKRSMGMSIHEFLLRHRMDEAMRLCRETPMLVKEIARRVGYSDPLYFSRVFQTYHRCWPTEVQRNNADLLNQASTN